MQPIPMRTAIALLAVLAALLLAACAASPAPIISTPSAPPLPTPATVTDAALTNLRPLTTSGGAHFGVWTTDGRGLVFAESDRPLLSILFPGNLPKIVTKEASLDRSPVRTLGEGFPLFFSPDGRTLYLNRELATDDVWLAELTDRATLASLPTSTPMPVPSPTPPLPLPPATMSSEDVIRRFWQAIDAKDFVTAYATRASANRARTGLAYFRSDWECVDRARVLEIAPIGEAAGNERMFTVQAELRVKPDCDGWMQPGPFASLVRETVDGPWLIQAFNTGP